LCGKADSLERKIAYSSGRGAVGATGKARPKLPLSLDRSNSKITISNKLLSRLSQIQSVQSDRNTPFQIPYSNLVISNFFVFFLSPVLEIIPAVDSIN
jgi:hypothetical protein